MGALKRKMAACVKQGALFMDERHPGWHENVNIFILDIGCYCVLGQLFGVYGVGVRHLQLSMMQEVKLGFISYTEEKAAILTQCWRAEIMARREHRKERMATQKAQLACKCTLAVAM